MNKYFNITAHCKPDQHYMVSLDTRLLAIKEMVDNGAYFTINRARQYGKTTTLWALYHYLRRDYHAVFMDFQEFDDAKFADGMIFSVSFAKKFLKNLLDNIMIKSADLEAACNELKKNAYYGNPYFSLQELFEHISNICACADKKLVLMIDEVDNASNNQVFLDFLSQLRALFIKRDVSATFQSVILAGVHDVKNLRRKLRPEDEHRLNSPWNIAADFTIDMSFSAEEIAQMLQEYDSDHKFGMDVNVMSELIYDYTAGYPYLVSRLCKILDEQICGAAAWTAEGFLEAVKILVSDKNTLFESMTAKLSQYTELKDIIQAILFTGRSISYNALDPVIDMAAMFGFIKNTHGLVTVANRIFETVFYNMFLTSSELHNTEIYKEAVRDKSQFIENGHLNMERILARFVMHFDELYGDQPDSFKEEDGRRYFLLYLRPIINGTGNYYIESRTRNMERTDVIVDYNGEQYIVELKIWRGNSYHERGEAQLAAYLEHYHLTKGYMLSFSFNKNKEIGVKHVMVGEKLLVEAVV
ncbi:MAG: AAA-like domain-containing protein [Lachnospiraceae bacterium]|nr:AAA-like domain-containing protein [Lachnospiraceae bacterium]